MDAHSADLDGDGDLDIVIAGEFSRNILLLNDGTGRFSQAAGQLPGVVHDSEDVAIADFDGDGDLDLLFVSEDDQTNELYLNDGRGVFTDASDRIPVAGTSNAVLASDIDLDGDVDVFIGNAGQNVLLLNDGTGHFIDETARRLPTRNDATQDLELGDIDGDGDLDLLVGNEDDNRLLLNTGGGFFIDESLERLPVSAGQEETREADFGDIDGDGDLDIFFANVMFIPGKNPQNRLLINDGSGVCGDITAENLPVDRRNTVDGDLIDIDADGDLDLITANAFGGGFILFINDGSGTFFEKASSLPPNLSSDGIDSEAADFNGDGRIDLYFCNYTGSDFLLFGQDTR